MPNPKPTTINPKDSRYERGTTGGQVAAIAVADAGKVVSVTAAGVVTLPDAPPANWRVEIEKRFVAAGAVTVRTAGGATLTTLQADGEWTILWWTGAAWKVRSVGEVLRMIARLDPPVADSLLLLRAGGVAEYLSIGANLSVSGGALNAAGGGAAALTGQGGGALPLVGVGSATTGAPATTIRTHPTLAANLVSLWNWSGGSVVDLVGANSGGSVLGPAPTAGPVDAAYLFDGVNDAISIPSAANLTFSTGAADTAFSLSAWIWCDNATGSYAIVGKSNGSTAGEWALLQKAGRFALRLIDNTGNADIEREANTSVVAGRWQHVVASYGGSGGESGLRIHVDGTETASSTPVQAPQAMSACGPRRCHWSSGPETWPISGFRAGSGRWGCGTGRLGATEIAALYGGGAGLGA